MLNVPLELVFNNTLKLSFVSSEDSDQPVQPQSLIRFFDVCKKE